MADTTNTLPPHNYYPIRAALEEFVRDIEMSGGVVQHGDGAHAPAGEPGWTDLGSTYLNACTALGRDAQVRPSGLASADEV